MLVGIHQPHYLPWLRYFEKIDRVDTFIVLDNIQYSKNGWQNRNRIRSASGTTLLTVPVRARLGQTLDAVTIENGSAWRRKHWETIRQSYGRAPHWTAYAPFLESVYARPWDTLNALNAHMLAGFLDALGIQTRIEYASDLAVPGTATDRLVNLIRAVGGTGYYSGAYALAAYLDAGTLNDAGIDLELQEWHSPVYPQLHGEYLPDLSIIDLLMNCGPDARDILAKGGQ